MSDYSQYGKKKETQQASSFISIKKASLLTGIGPQTLRTLADNQKIPSYRTPSGQRKFDRESLQKMCSPSFSDQKIGKDGKSNFLYARVSSKKQCDDLDRQMDSLKRERPKDLSFIPIQDVGSGINFKRKGLLTILDACLQGTIGTVIVAHRDRLSRFAFDLIESLITRAGGQLVVLESQNNKTSEQELSEDLLSIVHIYSCRQMGRRKYKRYKQNLQNNSPQANNRADVDIKRMDGNM